MTKRNEGVDLFRAVAMLMVVVLHVMNHGGVLAAMKQGTPLYNIAWLMQTCAYCAVNCYALISGYVGVQANHRYRKMLPLWLQVAFYSVVITVLFGIFMPGSVDKGTMIASVFPVVHRRYWYFTAYFGLYMLMPLINRGVRAMTKPEAQRFVATVLAVFSLLAVLPYINVLESFQTEDVFQTGEGFSVLWLAIMYTVGGCIRVHGLGRSIPGWKLGVGYAVSVIFTWSFKLLVEESASAWLQKTVDDLTFLYYTAPTMVIASVCLLLLFARLEKLPDVAGKVVRFLTPSVFAVYLIHENKLVRTHLISGRFAAYAQESPAVLLYTAATAVGIFLLCCLVDQVRRGLFRVLRINQIVNRIPAGGGSD